jgi:hypothetical protein
MAVKQPQSVTNNAVVVSTTSVTIIAAGLGTQYRSISNTSGQTMYVLFGTGTALVGSHTVPMAAGAFYEFPWPLFAGPVQASLATGSGTILITAY